MKLVAHHIGARGFGVSFNIPARFREDVVHVLYEADADAVRRMEGELDSEHAKMLREKYVLPFCMGRRRGRAKLNITANSYASSVFPPAPGFFRYYCEIPIDAGTYDVTYREMLEVVREVEVEVHALDELFAEGRIPIDAVPDFLSLDTQGYELEILHGAEQTLGRGVLGIISEVEMIPMYEGQPLLGDILNFATARGFLFAGLTTQFDVSPHRAPVGVRGKALPGFGDALFLRDLAWFTEARFPADQLYVMLHKLAFIAVSFSLIEYALAALAQAESLRDRVTAAVAKALQRHEYARFLDEMKRTATAMESLFPPVHAVPDDSRPAGDRRTSWYNAFHQAAMSRYAAMQAAAQTGTTDPVAALKQSSIARLVYGLLPGRLARALRRRLIAGAGVAAVPANPGVNPDVADAAPMPTVQTFTPFKTMLDNWGFAGPAYVVRRRRLASEPFVRSLDAEMYRAGAEAHLPRRGGQ